jgi:hypothetical protein
MQKLPPLVALHWHDTVGNGGWHTHQDARGQVPMPIITVGFLVNKTKSKITITHGIALFDTDVKYMDLMTIPAHNVFKISRLSLRVNNAKKNHPKTH